MFHINLNMEATSMSYFLKRIEKLGDLVNGSLNISLKINAMWI